MTESRPILNAQNFLRRKSDRFERDVIEEITSLRAALDIQLTRIAHLEAELDILSAAGHRHEPFGATIPSRPHNGDGANRR